MQELDGIPNNQFASLNSKDSSELSRSESRFEAMDINEIA